LADSSTPKTHHIDRRAADLAASLAPASGAEGTPAPLLNTSEAAELLGVSVTSSSRSGATATTGRAT
jgi:hypothetical protein